MALVLTTRLSRKRVTEIIVETVALRTAVDVAVEQDTVGLVVNEVSLVKDVFAEARGALNEVVRFHHVYTELNDLLLLKPFPILLEISLEEVYPQYTITSQNLYYSQNRSSVPHTSRFGIISLLQI